MGPWLTYSDAPKFVSDKKYRPSKGGRINVPYTGSHWRVTIYWSQAKNGRLTQNQIATLAA